MSHAIVRQCSQSHTALKHARTNLPSALRLGLEESSDEASILGTQERHATALPENMLAPDPSFDRPRFPKWDHRVQWAPQDTRLLKEQVMPLAYISTKIPGLADGHSGFAADGEAASLA